MDRLYMIGPKKNKKKIDWDDDEYDDIDVDYDEDSETWDDYEYEEDFINTDDPYSMY